LIYARCESGPRLVLSQRPYRALGSPVESRVWRLPVCARVAGRDAPVCTLLSAPTGEIPLGAGECPDWFYANARASGYYRTLQDAAEARRVLDGPHLTAAGRVAVVGDLGALVSSGDVSAGDVLGLLPLLASDANRDVHREIESFFGPRSASVEGAPRVLAQVLEAVDQCVALKKAQQPSLAAYLESRPES
jgi:hypothetical protein